jgi:hypothetical protein
MIVEAQPRGDGRAVGDAQPILRPDGSDVRLVAVIIGEAVEAAITRRRPFASCLQELALAQQITERAVDLAVSFEEIARDDRRVGWDQIAVRDLIPARQIAAELRGRAFIDLPVGREIEILRVFVDGAVEKIAIFTGRPAALTAPITSRPGVQRQFGIEFVTELREGVVAIETGAGGVDSGGRQIEGILLVALAADEQAEAVARESGVAAAVEA